MSEKLISLRNTMGKFFDNLDQNISGNVDRLIDVNFNTLRKMAHKDTLIGGIVKKRCDQMKPFSRISLDDRGKKDVRGFKVVNKKTGGVDNRAKEIMSFFENTGFGYDENREDDFIDVTEMIVRDTLIIDQVAIELRRNKQGEIFDFWVLDGATIKRNVKKNSQCKYVQILDSKNFGKKIVARFKNADMIFDYMNKRSDIRYRGYGYSPLEQSIDLITTFLFGMMYNRDQFVKDKIPKGFIKVMGDIDPSTISVIQRYWYQQMSGYGARFRIPIIPSGKEGVGMDFQKLGDSNKDMEYHKLIHLVMALKATAFGIDLAELGIKVDDSQALIGESGETRLQYSKDSGLGSLLIFCEGIWNKILKKIDEKYVFEYVGVKDEDRKQMMDIRKSELQTTKTINQLRKEDGDEEIDEDYANVVLNDQAVQIYGQSQQASMFGGEEGAEGIEEEEGKPTFGKEKVEEEEETVKSLRKSKNKIIII